MSCIYHFCKKNLLQEHHCNRYFSTVGSFFIVSYFDLSFSDLMMMMIIIIIFRSIPRRAFQYLFTSDTFDRLINVYKNNYKRNL
jgi:hypothetical protein